MPFVDLACADRVLRIDASICEMASERVHWRQFLAKAGASPDLTVRRMPTVQGTSLDAPLGKCTFKLDDDTLDVAVEDGMYRGELVLRLCWYLLGTGQGAVLIHACALREGDSALVAAGKSGDGKSTLSRLGSDAGLELLTDEVVMLFPDGRICGTPFRSDFTRPGAPGLTRAKFFFALKKAPHEALEPLSALEATQLAMSQCFDVAEVALPRSEVRKRLLAFLSNVELRTLAFRKDAAAGSYVRQLLQRP
jgi:hypothetical protein